MPMSAEREAQLVADCKPNCDCGLALLKRALDAERKAHQETRERTEADRARLDFLLAEGCYLGHMSRRFKNRKEIDRHAKAKGVISSNA